MARTRSCLRPVIFLAFLLSACRAVPARGNGVPSISSIGFGVGFDVGFGVGFGGTWRS